MGTQLHILQVVDWQKFSAIEWLEQFGAWVRSCRSCINLGCGNSLAAMIDKADTTKRRKNRPAPISLKISDDEARAVQRVLLDMLDSNDLDLAKWAWVLVQRYELNLSLGTISDLNDWSKTTVSRFIDKGIKKFSEIIFTSLKQIPVDRVERQVLKNSYSAEVVD